MNSDNALTDILQASLRKAEAKDCRFIWELRNEEGVRKSSFNSAPIPYEEHEKWYSSILGSEDTQMFVVLDKDRKEIGQIRFDVGDDGDAEINISIAAIYRNRGYGSTAIRLGCKYVLEDAGIKRIVAHVKIENQASMTAFSRAGFTNEGPTEFKGQKANQMVYYRVL